MAETKQEAEARVAADHARRQRELYGNASQEPPILDPRTPAGRAASGVYREEQARRLGVVPTAPAFAQVEGKAAELVGKLHPGEPIFIFRAQDILSVMILSHYAMLLEQYGDLEMIESVVNWRAEFQNWQRANPGLVKLPD